MIARRILLFSAANAEESVAVDEFSPKPIAEVQLRYEASISLRSMPMQSRRECVQA